MLMSSNITNSQIIQQFKWAAAVSQVQGANPFVIRAYQNAIESIESLDEELSDYILHDTPDTIPGIGHDLSLKIKDLLSTGKSDSLEKLFAAVPSGMFPLLEVPGIGAKKAFRLSTVFHLDDPKTAQKELKQLAKQDKISQLEGFGEKSQQQILQDLGRVKPKSDRIRLDQADKIAFDITSIIGGIKGIQEIVPLGSLRRRSELVGDVDIGVKTTNPDAVSKFLRNHPDIEQVRASGKNLIRIILKGNRQVDIKFQSPDKWGATLQHFTGSKVHNVALRELALKKSMSLSEHGIKKSGKQIPISSEEEFYRQIGLDYISPELRENTGEIQAAKLHRLPHLVASTHIKGDFHTHTSFNWKSSHDYGDDVTFLLSKATDLGYEWLILGDHNPSQSSYSNQQILNQVDKRAAWIEQQYSSWKQTVKSSTLNILNTLEVDIKPNGDLALATKAMQKLDFAIVAIHSSFNKSQADQTNRVIKAISHPNVKILGHPSGRLVNQRHPISLDWEKVFKACSSKNVALEINANPHRLDLPDTLVKQAKHQKCKFALGTDAHISSQLDYMPYAISVARRGWLESRDIINTYSFEKVTNWLQS